MSQAISKDKIDAYLVLCQTLLQPWQDGQKNNPENLIAMATALEELAAEYRLAAAHLYSAELPQM